MHPPMGGQGLNIGVQDSVNLGWKLAQVSAPSAVLVRPDGHVAWVGEGSDAGLRDALTRWFGPADAAVTAPPDPIEPVTKEDL